MIDLIIRNAKITTADNTFIGNIAIKDGKIVELGEIDNNTVAKEVIDAGGKPVIPGLIDTHCHIGWPDWDWGEECIATTKAAAAGGVTTVMLMDGTTQSMFKQLEESFKVFKENSYIDGTFHEII